jgi:hypothetical protein
MKTSVKNWIDQLDSGKFKNNAVKVLRFIKDNPNTNIEIIRSELKMAHQTSSSAISHLMNEGLLKHTKEININGVHYNELMFVDNESEMKHLKAMREKEKYNTWLKRGIEDFTPYMSSQLIMQLTIELI